MTGRSLKIALALFVIGLLPGCGTSALEKEAAPGLDSNRAFDFAKPCRDLHLAREYGQAERCLGEKEDYIERYRSTFREDIELSRAYGGKKRTYALMRYGAAVARGELWLDYGEADQAYRVMAAALKGASFDHLTAEEKIEVQRLAGVSAALEHDSSRALKHLQVIADIEEGKDDLKRVGFAKKFAIADIFLALEDYSAADSAMKKPDKKDWGGVLKLAMSLYLYRDPANGFEQFYGVSSNVFNAASLMMLPPGTGDAYEFRTARVNYRTGQLDAAEQGYRSLIAKHYFGMQYPGLYVSTLTDLASIAETRGRPDDAITLLYQAIEVLEKHRRNMTESASRITYQANHSGLYGTLVRLLIHQKRYEDALVVAERAKCRELVESLSSRTESAADPQMINRVPDVRFDDLRDSIDARSAAVFYYRTQSGLYAWYVSKHAFRFSELDSAQIDRLLPNYLAVLRHPEDETYLGFSQTFYDLLLRPLAPEPDTRHLLIVPAMSLHYLPFASLHDGKFYLTDNYDTSVLPNLSILPVLSGYAPLQSQDAVVFGNPESNHASLEGSRAESNWVASLSDHSAIYQNDLAMESTFRKVSPDYPVIHYAGHAAFSPYSPLDSALIMAVGEGQDGRLTVKEIYDLRIKAELVTLSACETAVSGFDNGDEIIGLNQGFLFAGARGVLASLWKVSDDETFEFMRYFYQGWSHYPKAVALQLAQLKLRETHPHPYYWASFQLSGL